MAACDCGDAEQFGPGDAASPAGAGPAAAAEQVQQRRKECGSRENDEPKRDGSDRQEKSNGKIFHDETNVY
jgi:hypothetical protein